MDYGQVVSRTLRWYEQAARDLPWRRPDAGPWAIMVSEFMLQQTPVSRVLQPWHDWLQRWPSPTALAESPSGEAVRAWGRLGYPRRALRLHQAAVAIRDDHDGQIPDDHDALLALPGVGSYTAAAIASFAFGRRHVVLDTNVRRVQARIAAGVEFPHTSCTAADRALGAEFLPARADRAARWAVASMELGALICTSRAPGCEQCPVRTLCAWHRTGRPSSDGPPRQRQRYEGTDRQCRGALLAVLRSSDVPVAADELDRAWPDPVQRERALRSLITDRLVVPIAGDQFGLPA